MNQQASCSYRRILSSDFSVSRPRHKPTERFGMAGTARLTLQAPGTIRRFTLSCNNASTPAFCDSLKAAIHGSDPFPKPEFDELYDDTLVITFE